MVKNVNTQKWLNEKYPIDGVCERENDPENKGKNREQITELDISKGKIGKNNLFGEEKNLTGSLKLSGFTKLRKLIIFSHQITELDVSDCPNLEELSCHDNELTNLNVVGCSSLKKINCSNNNLKRLEFITCNKLEEVILSGCPLELTEEGTIKSNLVYDSKTNKLVKESTKNSPQITKAKDSDIRNILVIGMTGGGKSTLANVLTGNDNFEEKDSSTSVTERFQKSKVFEWRGKKYCVIDNIGFGDNSNLSERDILFKIGEGIHAAKEGINQVLFVISGRFNSEQIKAFNKFKNFVAESRIAEFTTLTKTSFADFENQQKCQTDLRGLVKENQELSEIIESCKDFIYVDNPPIPEIDEEDSEDEKQVKEQRTRINSEKRKKSRKIVLVHLVDNCLEIYKLKNWNDISSRVDNYIKREKEIEQSSVSQNEKEKSIEKEKELLAEELRLRLEFSPATLQAAVEVEAKGLSCSIL